VKDERRSPLVAQVILMVLFVILAGVGAVTVVVPELSEDGESADTDEAADTAEASADGDE